MLFQISRNILVTNVTVFLKKSGPGYLKSIPAQAANAIHTSKYRRKDKKNDSKPSALVLHFFENVQNKEKQDYLDILREYRSNNTLRRGHVEFIQVALKYMDEFGVNRDLEVYKAILDILPKGKFIPVNIWQTMFMHYPQQQYVAIDLLSKMEHNCVIPDVEMQQMLLNIFGVQGSPLKKFWRMMYWMPKFSNLNPWKCSRPLPKDPRLVAKLAINKLSSIDVTTIVTEYKTKELEDAIEDTWILSSMSRTQERLLKEQPTSNAVYVEGPYSVWVYNECIDYFVLRGDARRTEDVFIDLDDVSDIRIPFWDKREMIPKPTVHEQFDGTYFAMCATGTSSKDSLLSWIRFLQKRNPILNDVPVVFKISSATKNQLYIENSMRENEIARSQDYWS